MITVLAILTTAGLIHARLTIRRLEADHLFEVVSLQAEMGERIDQLQRQCSALRRRLPAPGPARLQTRTPGERLNYP